MGSAEIKYQPSANQKDVFYIDSYHCVTYIFILQGNSQDCGMNTGCVKIYKKAPEFDPYTGDFIAEHKRGPDVQLFRGTNIINH